MKYRRLDHIALFLAHVSRLYREQSNYHNFQHALDVLQATYYYLYSAGCVPHLAILNVRGPDSGSETSLSQGVTGGKPLAPLSQQRNIWHRQRGAVDSLLQRILRNEDIFALFVAAIGHDIGHPGLNNAFLVSSLVSQGAKADRSCRTKPRLPFRSCSATSPSLRGCTALFFSKSCDNMAWVTSWIVLRRALVYSLLPLTRDRGLNPILAL